MSLYIVFGLQNFHSVKRISSVMLKVIFRYDLYREARLRLR
jgi:hypothetical protein